ncbi:MAG: lytic transglycosylase domain-containing protein, partial [Acidobacteria bacterium]|nr:lytic transglycosylase domain-containing protein [Acidobacteriota bacterium]
NPRIGLNEAYQYSELLLKACDKYPTVDPLLFLSVGIVESGFNPNATSVANARGLYQIWPSTGRMLARALNWEYTEALLYDPERNTEMAAFYLDILFSAYNDPRMVLAEYNGGPLNAGYLRAGSAQAAETREYVVKVLDVNERLKRAFESGTDVRRDFIHLDAKRDGKALFSLPASASVPTQTSVLQ